MKGGPPRPTVILLHGLARTHRSLAGLQRHLEGAGFPTWSVTYPSRRMSLADLAAYLAQRIRAEVGAGEVQAVTHSMGGVVVRHMRDLLPWRGVVMLAPPNRGSRVALALRDRRLFRWFYGPAARELASGDDWPAPPPPFGVIAGTRAQSLVSLLRRATPARGELPTSVPSDGTVAVEETRYEGMADFATVDATHTLIMNHPLVREWVVRFLLSGRFREGGEGSNEH